MTAPYGLFAYNDHWGLSLRGALVLGGTRRVMIGSVECTVTRSQCVRFEETTTVSLEVRLLPLVAHLKAWLKIG
jgi:hypothetical protein